MLLTAKVLFYYSDKLFNVTIFETFCDCGSIKRNFFYLKKWWKNVFPSWPNHRCLFDKKFSLSETETGQTKNMFNFLLCFRFRFYMDLKSLEIHLSLRVTKGSANTVVYKMTILQFKWTMNFLYSSRGLFLKLDLLLFFKLLKCPLSYKKKN